MGESGKKAGLAAIVAAARRSERRIRLSRALGVAPFWVAVALGAALVALALRKLGTIGDRPTMLVWAGGAFVVGVAIVVAWVKRLPRLAGAVALDRHHALSGRLATAIEFSQARQPTPLMEAAIVDGAAHAERLDPRGAVPLRISKDWRWAAVLGAALAFTALFEIRETHVVAEADTLDAVDVTADDIDAMREFLRDMDQQSSTDDSKQAVAEFNRLVDDLADRRLDRTEAFRRMTALENKLLEGNEADRKALEEALKKIGEEMKKADLTKPAGDKIEQNELTDADKRLRDLAKKLREQGKSIDKAQLDKMRKALERASKANAERQKSLDEQRKKLEKELLNKKRDMADGGANEREKRLLEKKKRELERLNRQAEAQRSAKRQLDRLDRELAKAAADLAKDLGLSAQDLERGAEDLNRMARKQMTQKEKEQMRKKLEELREMLRRQGKGGKMRLVRLRNFQQRARGGQGQKGGQGGQGQGQNGKGQKPGQGGMPGGKGGKGGKDQTFVIGPGGQKLLMLSQGPGGSGQQPGQGAGTGHDSNVQGKATNPKSGTQDTQVAGQDTGQGPARSEVIESAAERGFASGHYAKVYREYHTVAEESLSKEEIPGGYRFYVRRYFQLIRPRDAN